MMKKKVIDLRIDHMSNVSSKYLPKDNTDKLNIARKTLNKIDQILSDFKTKS